MNYFKILILLLGIIQAEKCFGQTKFSKVLSQQIDSLKFEDQKPLQIKNSDSAAIAFQRVIRTNFPFVKNILSQYGFPGNDLVGEESSNNYWLLVQHSDFDVPFQKRALELMKVQVDLKNASGQKYAYLLDRININESRPQIYGTQVNMGEKGTTLKPCIDPSKLDERRLSVGLSPIKEYIKKCDDMFYEMNKGKLIKPVER